MRRLKNIVTEQDLTEIYRQEIGEILEFLGLDMDACLITDASSIDDFSTWYPELAQPKDDAAERYQ